MDEHESRAEAEEDEFERRLRMGQHEDLVLDLVNAVEAEPLRERRSRQLMLALYRCGRQVEALRVFQRLHMACLEAGTEPLRESCELDKAIALDRPELNWIGSDEIA